MLSGYKALFIFIMHSFAPVSRWLGEGVVVADVGGRAGAREAVEGGVAGRIEVVGGG